MPKKSLHISYITICMLVLLCTTCSNLVSDNLRLNPSETFSDDDKPASYILNSITLTGPWGYSKQDNASRLYPLVVAGMHGEGLGYYASVNKEYPAFVIEYRKDTYFDGQYLSDWIDTALLDGYRIDTKRIYLTGFSQGGSGSFPLAKGMANKGKYFAAIVRVAGQSQSDLTNDLASKTAVWYHLGLNDTEQRISVARDTLAKFRSYECNTNALESTSTDTITGHERSTITLTRSGVPYFKYSEYTGMGHSASACYLDQELFAWVFARKL